MNDNSHRVWSLRRLSQRFSETQINNVATQPFSYPEVTRRTGPPDKSDELRIRKEYFAHAPKIGAGKGILSADQKERRLCGRECYATVTNDW